MKRTTLILISILMPFIMKAQDKPFALDELIPGGSHYRLRPVMPRNTGFIGEKFIYVLGDSIFACDFKARDAEVLFTKKDVNALLAETELGKIYSMYSLSPLDSKLPYLCCAIQGKFILIDIYTKTVAASFQLPSKSENHTFSPDARYLAFTEGNNLKLLDREGNITDITNEANPDITFGANNVHRNEWGITKGIFWAPDSRSLAFYRMDQSMVGDYPLVDVSKREAELKSIKYPMAGMTSHRVKVGIYNIAAGETVYMATGKPEEKFLTNIAFSPDAASLFIATLNRGQDTCKLNRYSATTGKFAETLLTETNERYVEPLHPLLFLPDNSGRYIWQSRRDGYNHIYLYSKENLLLKQLTVGKWEVIDVLGFDAAAENIFYVCNGISAIENHIFKCSVKTGRSVCLSAVPGEHRGLLSAEGKYVADIFSSQNVPGVIMLTDSRKIKRVYEAKNPIQNRILPDITMGTIRTADNTADLYYRMVKPADFSAEKKYPVIVYVYGGPHSQMITNGWLAQTRGWDIYMAQKGYIVFTLDNRGTGNRGFEFESVIHRHLGETETTDQMAGIDYLKSLPYIDADRIGVHGWSYGGFMTLNLMLRHPDVFKVGVAGGPVTDWKYYEIMYGERYMDTPRENPDGYRETSMVGRAGDLKGRLLIIHGDEDNTVVMQHSLQFLKSAIKNNTYPDFFVYPGHEHNMTGADRVHLHEKITRYFEDFLK